MTTHGFVGDLLIRVGVVDAAGLARAVEVQPQHANNLGRALADLGLADESVVASVIASALRFEYLGEPVAVAEDVAALVPAEFCRKHRTVPLGVQGNLLRARERTTLAHVGVEAPARQGARSAHSGRMQATSNAARRDASAMRPP